MAVKKRLSADRLDEILSQGEYVEAEKVKKALEIRNEKGGRLSKILIENKFIDEKTLFSIIAREFGILPVDLSRLTFDPGLSKLIPEHILRRYNLIPISKLGDILTVAISDPADIVALDDIRLRTNLRIETVLASSKDISDAIERFYGGEKAFGDFFGDVEGEVETEVVKQEAFEAPELAQAVEEAPVVKLVDYFLAEAVKANASDILIEPFEKFVRVRFRQDGILREKETLPRNMNPVIVSRVKVISQLNIAERRLPQDGRFKAKVSGREIDFRVSVIPSTFGEKTAIRILDKRQLKLDMDNLGFEKEAAEKIKQCSLRPYGFILMCGPTGSGKTSTLYSILNFIDDPGKNLVTVEDPVEYELEGINQVAVKPKIGLTFANALRSILRQDPNVIMVGEIRDFDTVDMAIKSALTGHMVLSTLHTTDAVGSITRLLNMGVEPFLITSSLLMVGSQRLVRKICAYCKESYDVSTDLLKKASIDPDTVTSKKFFRGMGCDHCQKTGYSGRSGLIELLALDEEINSLIFKNAPVSEIRAAARRKGMVTLREDGIKKAVNGVTSIEEVIKVTAGE